MVKEQLAANFNPTLIGWVAEAYRALSRCAQN
jgi:hypothetical protein